MDPFDLEKINFLAWMQRAGPEEIRVAQMNNPEKLVELQNKYERELKIIAIYKGI